MSSVDINPQQSNEVNEFIMCCALKNAQMRKMAQKSPLSLTSNIQRFTLLYHTIHFSSSFPSSYFYVIFLMGSSNSSLNFAKSVLSIFFPSSLSPLLFFPSYCPSYIHPDPIMATANISLPFLTNSETPRKPFAGPLWI